MEQVHSTGAVPPAALVAQETVGKHSSMHGADGM